MDRQEGFTLIEVLLVTAIISVLSAIAVPQFLQFRMRGFDARAKIDLHNVATAEEANYIDQEAFRQFGLEQHHITVIQTLSQNFLRSQHWTVS